MSKYFDYDRERQLNEYAQNLTPYQFLNISPTIIERLNPHFKDIDHGDIYKIEPFGLDFPDEDREETEKIFKTLSRHCQRRIASIELKLDELEEEYAKVEYEIQNSEEVASIMPLVDHAKYGLDQVKRWTEEVIKQCDALDNDPFQTVDKYFDQLHIMETIMDKIFTCFALLVRAESTDDTFRCINTAMTVNAKNEQSDRKVPIPRKQTVEFEPYPKQVIVEIDCRISEVFQCRKALKTKISFVQRKLLPYKNSEVGQFQLQALDQVAKSMNNEIDDMKETIGILNRSNVNRMFLITALKQLITVYHYFFYWYLQLIDIQKEAENLKQTQAPQLNLAQKSVIDAFRSRKTYAEILKTPPKPGVKKIESAQATTPKSFSSRLSISKARNINSQGKQRLQSKKAARRQQEGKENYDEPYPPQPPSESKPRWPSTSRW